VQKKLPEGLPFHQFNFISCFLHVLASIVITTAIAITVIIICEIIKKKRINLENVEMGDIRHSTSDSSVEIGRSVKLD